MRIPGSRSTYRLPILGLWQQLQAGRLVRRWLQLAAGLVVAALAIALMVEARLGLDPWNVLHEGLVKHLSVSFGTVTIVSGLLCWCCRSRCGSRSEPGPSSTPCSLVG